MSYDPTLGRFLERDPIGSPNMDGPGKSAVVLDAENGAMRFITNLAGPENWENHLLWQYAEGMNSYEFDRDNPINFVDPSGLGPNEPGRVINESDHSIWVFDSDDQLWFQLAPGQSTPCISDIDGFYDPKYQQPGEVYKVSGNTEAHVYSSGAVTTGWNSCSPQTCGWFWLTEALIGDLLHGGITTPPNIGDTGNPPGPPQIKPTTRPTSRPTRGPTTAPTSRPAAGAAR